MSTLASLWTSQCFTHFFCFQQLEKELVERQPQVDLLQETSNSLVIKGHGEDYIEAEEKVHVIEKKLKQLREQVSQDLMSLQGTQVSLLVAFKCKDYHITCKQDSSVAANPLRQRPEARARWSEQGLMSCPFLAVQT